MFGSKYKPKSLGRLSAAAVAQYHDNCVITSEVVPTSRVKGSMWRYYGALGKFHRYDGLMDDLFALVPSEWVTADDVPDGLAWERRLLRPQDSVPRVES